MKTAILGGAGFIGTNLVENLQTEHNCEISIFDNFSMGNQLSRIDHKGLRIVHGNMESFTDLCNFLKEVKPDRIYHLVANSDIASASLDPNLDVVNTFSTTINLINCLKLSQVQEVIFASSSAVYGEHKGKISEVTPFSPISSYGWMKAASEVALQRAVDAGLMHRLLIARFPNVTGKYQTHGVVFDLVKKLRLNKDSLQVLGNGYQNKPYLAADKLVEVIVKLLMLKWEKSLVINIAPEDRIDVRSIVNLILEYSGVDLPVNYEEAPHGWVGDIPSYELETHALREILPNLILPSSRESIFKGIRYMWDDYEL